MTRKAAKLKIYLDTSVINFLYADDAPEKKAVTIEFFDKYLTSYQVFISDIVLFEIRKTRNQERRNLLLAAADQYQFEFIKVTNSNEQHIIDDLAARYIRNRIIPASKHEDALHIAICTYFELDILLSWNFRHLANIQKQYKINDINKRMGYIKSLNLLTPMEVIYEG